VATTRSVAGLPHGLHLSALTPAQTPAARAEPAGDPIDFERTIEQTLRDIKRRFMVRKVRFDPYQMHATAQRLVKAGVKMEEFPQSVPNLTEASTHLYELIKGRTIALYPDADIRLAISRAVAVEGSRGWKISKDKQSHKIDIVIALAMAALAAVRGQSESSYDTSMRWVTGEPDDETDEERRAREDADAQEFQRMRYMSYIASGGWRRPWYAVHSRHAAQVEPCVRGVLPNACIWLQAKYVRYSSEP
jgi:hypothetical protein